MIIVMLPLSKSSVVKILEQNKIFGRIPIYRCRQIRATNYCLSFSLKTVSLEKCKLLNGMTIGVLALIKLFNRA